MMSINVTATGHTAQIMTDEENMVMVMDMTTNMGLLGGELSTIMYLNMVDGDINFRMIEDGYELPSEFFYTEMIDEMVAEIMSPLPVLELYDIVSVEIEEDGDYTTFHLLVDGEILKEFMQAMVDAQMIEMLDMHGYDATFEFEVVEDPVLILEVYGSDDNPVSFTMVIDVVIFIEWEEFEEMDGQELNLWVENKYIYTAFGDDVVITPPEQGLPFPETPDPQNEIVLTGEPLENPDVFVGTWAWDMDDSYTYVFYADGTASRGFTGATYYFWWATEGDDHLLIEDDFATESWTFVIENGVLTISSRQVPGLEFIYIFQGENLDDDYALL
jgi:hypothetical protein